MADKKPTKKSAKDAKAIRELFFARLRADAAKEELQTPARAPRQQQAVGTHLSNQNFELGTPKTNKKKG